MSMEETVFGWLLFSFTALGSLLFGLLTIAAQPRKREYYVTAYLICTLAAFQYLCSTQEIGYMENADGKYIYAARYVENLFTLPLTLLAMGMLGGASVPAMGALCALGALTVACDFVGAVAVEKPGKSIWWTFGTVFFLVKVGMLFSYFKGDENRARKVTKLYRLLLLLLFIPWLLNRAMWMAGKNGFGAVPAHADYSVAASMDLLTKFVFCLLLLLNKKTLAETSGGGPSDGAGAGGDQFGNAVSRGPGGPTGGAVEASSRGRFGTGRDSAAGGRGSPRVGGGGGGGGGVNDSRIQYGGGFGGGSTRGRPSASRSSSRGGGFDSFAHDDF